MFLIGEFSKISRVSKRSLHYYDDIGLLTPAHIDRETGYRYYSAKQLPRLNRILALKDLGMSLEQIAKMLKTEVSDEEIHGMLLLKKAEMEQQVFEDLQRLKRIEARIQQNREPKELPDVVIKSIPAQRFLSFRTVFSGLEDIGRLVEQLLRLLPTKVKPGILGQFTAVFYADSYEPTNHDIDIGFLLKRPVRRPIRLTDDIELQMSELPAVDAMASMVQKVEPDLEFLALTRMGKWIEENGYRMNGPYRELGFDITSPADFDNGIIEFQIPVEKATSVDKLFP